MKPLCAALAFFGLAMTAAADEGMWLLNDPPRDHLKAKYGFDLTDDWLTHARLASVRFNNGGSGSFLSPNGLVLTNHHVGADLLQKVSPPGKDYYRDGFYAKSPADEPKCPDLELNVLTEIVDVTARINDAVAKAPNAATARRQVMAEIESESLKATGLRSDVVTLYQGGLYHLYRYQKYTDVRLVFAPEQAVANFGGDTDNFEYPRYSLDICFFRVYEKGEPVKPKHWLTINPAGPKEGDLVFVTGHPGTTNRLETLAKLQHRRDVTLPFALARLRAFEAALMQFSERDPAFHQQAAADVHRVANARKAFAGQFQGLLDPAVLSRKARDEAALQQFYFKPGSGFSGDPWRQIADANAKYAAFEREYNLLETGTGFFSELFALARHLVRLADELPKPSATRLREYRDSNLDSLKLQLFSSAPVKPDLEQAKLAASLTFLAEQLSVRHAVVEKTLAGKPPAVLASELVRGTKLADVAERRKLFDGGRAAVEASSDPLIRLALAVDVPARQLRSRHETEVEEVERQAYGLIAQARFKQSGRAVAPDATFTLRLAFGTVKGYVVDGQTLPPWTTFAGLYDRSARQGARPPFELPERWLKLKGQLDATTMLDFASTADTIGGNSGSPVLNRAGEFIGINFDRNRHGLVRNFVYTEEQARHIAVSSPAVVAALKLFSCRELLAELQLK